MAFLRATPAADPEADIRGTHLYLRHPTMQDYAAWAELRALSRAHLTPWEPQWSRDELTRSNFRRRLRQYHRELRDDHGYAYLIFSDTECQLLGGLNLSNVRRGAAQASVSARLAARAREAGNAAAQELRDMIEGLSLAEQRHSARSFVLQAQDAA